MTKRRRWTRRLALGALGVVGLVAVLWAISLWLVHSPGNQQRIVRRISARTEAALGISVEARSFRLSVAADLLTVDGLTLRAGDGPALATVERLRAELRPLSLLRGSPHLDEVVLDRLFVDLDRTLAALPKTTPEPDAVPRVELPLRIDRLAVRDSRVAGGAVGDALAGWSLARLEVEAGFDGRRLELGRLTARAGLRPSWIDQGFDLDVELGGRAALDGAIEIDKLRLEGEALSASLTGATAAGLAAPRASFEISGDAGRWLTGEPAPPIEAKGELDLAAWEGRLELRAADQPAALARAYLAPALVETLAVEATSLDLMADLELEKDRSLAGLVRLDVRRTDASASGQRIVEIVARPRLQLVDGLPLEATVQTELLPAAAGRRRVDARFRAGRAADLESWRIGDGVLTVAEENVSAAIGRFSALYPNLIRFDAPAELAGLGALAASGDFDGPLLDPRLALRAELTQPGGGRLRLGADGSVRAGPLRVVSTGRRFDIGRFTSAVEGTLDWSATVDDALGAPRGRLELTADSLATATGPVARSLTATVEGDRQRLDWRLVAGRDDGSGLKAGGRVEPRLPLRRASGEGRITTADPRVPSLDATFELAAGALRAGAEVALAGREPLTVDARLPLASLAELPLPDAVATLPLERSPGPIEIEWRAAPGSWLALVPPELAERVTELTAGSAGSLVFEPACPACSSVEATLDGLDLTLDGRRVRAVGELPLTLAEKQMRVGPLELAGEGLTFNATAELALDAGWRLGDAVAGLGGDLDVDFAGQVDSVWLEALPLEVVERGVVTLTGTLEGPLDRPAGKIELAAPALLVALDALPNTPLGRPAATLAFADGLVSWREARLEAGPARVVSSGRTRVAAPLDELAGRVDVATGLPVLERVALPFALAGGRLTVDGATFTTPGGEGTLGLDVSIDPTQDGAAKLAWELPANDWAPLLRRLGGSEDPDVFEAAFRGSAEWSPEHPTRLSGRAILDQTRIVSRGRETRIEPALEIVAADGVLQIPPLLLRSGDESFSFTARADLDPGWTPARPPAELVSAFELRGDGELDAGLLNPFLAGGRGDGPLRLELDLDGSVADWNGRVRVQGPAASLLFRGTYLVRLERPDLDLVVDEGVVRLAGGSAAINEGTAAFSGIVWDGQGTDLEMRLSDARFRLDYGLLTTVDADLRLTLTGEGSTLAGSVGVERGMLTRTLRPDIDFLTGLLTPIDLSTTEESALDGLALELEIRTREGVRIDNNLAEMLVRWEPLTVTGTAARPLIEGRLEADPGGLLFLYGQTVRLDSASIEYTGEENADARLDFEATTSLEDPTIGQLAGSDPFRSIRRTDEAPVADPTGDLARYFGESLAGRVGEAVGVSLSLRPVLIFGETDPGGRLTVSRDFSAYLSLAASVDLRQAESQTYVLELHELEALPRLVTQVFTDDQSSFGTVLLQRREFGGSRLEVEADLPRVRKLVLDPPPGVSRRGMRRAAGLARGEVLDADRRFAAEVELADYLRRRGYADATVTIRPLDAGSRTRLEVTVDPGPRARFTFTGETLSKGLRALITDLYRPDFYEPESLDEMKSETVRALRSRGFLDPEVTIDVTPLDPSDPGGARQVTIHTEGGIRIAPKPPRFIGVPPDAVALLDALFFNSVQRVELAVGLPSADRRLLAALAQLGYPGARILSRYEALGDRILTVEIDPGPRQRIAAVALAAADDAADLPPDLAPLLAVAPGDPLDRRAVARSALAVERALGARGHRQARVRTVVEPAGGDPGAMNVRFDVMPGPVSRIAAVDVTGTRSTREGWARSVAGLEPGEILTRNDLPDARTRLWRTGLFSAVSTQTSETDPGSTRVVFDLAERPRFQLAYGVRWDSETGIGAVVDATDHNFLGRGWTLGLRALSSSDEKSLRWLTRVPRVFGGRGSFELFAGASEIRETVFDRNLGFLEEVSQTLETTLQYSHPLDDATTLRIYGRYADTVTEAEFFTDEIIDPALGVQLLFDTRSPEPVLRRGLFASVDLSGSEEALGGDLRYVRLFSQLHVHRPLGPSRGRLTWSQSYRLGLAEAFDQVLISKVRFFAGGEYSVRGYATESLGSHGFLGAQGGAALVVINQELRWRLFDDYTLIGFADAGEVWPQIGDLGLDLRTAAGIGLRAITPIGLVRIDLAHALDGRPGIDPDFKLYFGLGTVF